MITENIPLKKAYDKAVLEEYKRLDSSDGNVEFNLVTSEIQKYVQENQVIFDIGCGPGKYVDYLLKNHYKVGCLDISKKSIDFINKRLKLQFDSLLFSEVGCACDIELLGLGKANAMLLLGPMYHLINPNSRKKAIKNCHQVLKKDGVLFSMFLNHLPKIDEFHLDKHNVLDWQTYDNYSVTWTEYKGEKIPQYRCSPKQAISEFKELFKVLDVVPISKNTDSDDPLHTKEGQFLVVFKK